MKENPIGVFQEKSVIVILIATVAGAALAFIYSVNLLRLPLKMRESSDNVHMLSFYGCSCIFLEQHKEHCAADQCSRFWHDKF